MSDYADIIFVMNTTTDMEHLVDNVPHDDDTMTFTGVNWFKFNDVVAENIYVSGNSWIGIGTSVEQLKVCCRDAKMYHFYRQEGTIANEKYHFLKLRWEGYSYYQSTSDVYKLAYEVFLISDGRMFLNIIQSPTNSSYLGTSALVCGNENVSFTVGTTAPYYFTFTPTNSESGVGWSVDNSIIELFDKRYLISDKNEKIYTVVNDELVELSETTLTKSLFLLYGLEDIPDNDLLLLLENPKVHLWKDSSSISTSLTATVTQTPYPQLVVTDSIELIDSTIIGIDSVTIDSDENTLFAMSFDDGSTWWNYVNDTWGQLSETMSGQIKSTIEDIGTNAWGEKITAGDSIKFRFVLLSSNGYVNNITIHYMN